MLITSNSCLLRVSKRKTHVKINPGLPCAKAYSLSSAL